MSSARSRKKVEKPMAAGGMSFTQMLGQLEGEVGKKNQSDDPRKQLITGDEVKFHGDGEYISVPTGTTYEWIFTVAERLMKDANSNQTFHWRCDYRPFDGAYAAAAVLKEMFGVTLGKQGEWGPESATVSFKVSVDEEVTVPWGTVVIPILDNAEFTFAASSHPKFGAVFTVAIEGLKKHKPIYDEIFANIESYLKTGSIYRGKALVGADDLEFMDLRRFDPSKVVFSTEVETYLRNAILAPIANTELLELNGMTVKRKVLLHGPYGTGKTSLGMLVAQQATSHGWTFIMARPGVDSINDIINTAKMYQPAVILFEDFDVDSESQNSKKISQMLESLDGATSKSDKIIAILTTNHIEKLHPGMMRPGRIDYFIEIAGLDADGVQRLVEVVVGKDRLDDDIDFQAVYDSMPEFLPAFVKAVADRALLWALNRTQSSNFTISTKDLVDAATSLKPQYALMKAATEPVKEPTLDKVVRDLVTDGVDKMGVLLPGVPPGRLEKKI